MADSSGDGICCVCMNDDGRKLIHLGPCGHEFCNVCIAQIMAEVSQVPRCPLCRCIIMWTEHGDTATPTWVLDKPNASAVTTLEVMTLLKAARAPRYMGHGLLQTSMGTVLFEMEAVVEAENHGGGRPFTKWLGDFARVHGSRVEEARVCVNLFNFFAEGLIGGLSDCGPALDWIATVDNILVTHTHDPVTVQLCLQTLRGFVVESLPRVFAHTMRAAVARVTTSHVLTVGWWHGPEAAAPSTNALSECMHLLEVVAWDLDAECAVDATRLATECLRRFGTNKDGNCRLARKSLVVLQHVIESRGGANAGTLVVPDALLPAVAAVAAAHAANSFVVTRVAALTVALLTAEPWLRRCDHVLGLAPVLTATIARCAASDGAVTEVLTPCVAVLADLGAHSDNRLVLNEPATMGAMRDALVWVCTHRLTASALGTACCQYFARLASHCDNHAAVAEVVPQLHAVGELAIASPHVAAVAACAACYKWLAAWGAGKCLVRAGVVPWATHVLSQRRVFGDAAIEGCVAALGYLAHPDVGMEAPCLVAAALLVRQITEEEITGLPVFTGVYMASDLAHGCAMFFRNVLDSPHDTVRDMCRGAIQPSLLCRLLRGHRPESAVVTVEVLQCFLRLSVTTTDLVQLFVGVKCVDSILLGPQGGSVEVAAHSAALLCRLINDQREGVSDAEAVATIAVPLRRLLERFGSDAEVARYAVAAFATLSGVPANRTEITKHLPLLGTVAARHAVTSVAADLGRITRNLSGGRGRGGGASGAPPLPKMLKTV